MGTWNPGPAATEGRDTFIGDGSNDNQNGLGGRDTLYGNGGTDNLYGGGGDDHIYGGDEMDFLGGGNGDDHIWGGQGGDHINDSAGNDTYYGEEGNDVFIMQGRLNGGVNTFDGGSGLDIVTYYWDPYFSTGVGLTLSLVGGSLQVGSSTTRLISIEGLEGSAGNDNLTGDAGANHLYGAGGGDFLYGLGGNDFFYGDEPTDIAHHGDDTIDGGDGFDVVLLPEAYNLFSFSFAANMSLMVTGPEGTDTLRNIEGIWFINANTEVVVGSADDDALTGLNSPDIIGGGAGNDTISGGGGGDWLFGGTGSDTVDYSNSASRVIVDLGAGTASGGDASGDILNSVERLTGSNFADVLTGNAANNVLRGADGNDRLAGGAGADTMDGGDDFDVVTYDRRAGSYSFQYTANGDLQVSRLISFGTYETDTLRNVERLVFNDQTVNLVPSTLTPSTAESIFQLHGYMTFMADLAAAAYKLTPGEAAFNWTPSGAREAAYQRVGAALTLLQVGDFAFSGAPHLLPIRTGAEGLLNGMYVNVNAAVLLARSSDGLFISFRGTNDDHDRPNHWFAPGEHYALLQGIVDAVRAMLLDPSQGIQHVYVTGHSLGGAMVEAFMDQFPNAGGVDFHAVTFASRGYGGGFSNHSDDRIVSFWNERDVIRIVSPLFQSEGDINIFHLKTSLGSTDQHDMDLYLNIMKFLRVEGLNIDQEGVFVYDNFVFAANPNFVLGVGDNILDGSEEIIPGPEPESLPNRDFMLGGAGNDTLRGGGASDRLLGGVGADTLDGGLGRDTLTGGAGNDIFVFNTAPADANRDTITDYNVAADTIQLARSAFAGLGAEGALVAQKFHIGSAAHDASDRIIYNNQTGELYYDQDGNGIAHGLIHFATLSAGLGGPLFFQEFVVI